MRARLMKWVPVVDVGDCIGCGACIEACGPKSLALVDGVAALVQSDTCGSEQHCIAPCPTACIHMEWIEMDGNHHRGKWQAAPARGGPNAAR